MDFNLNYKQLFSREITPRVNLCAYFWKIFGAECQVGNCLAQSFGAEQCSDQLWRSKLMQKQRVPRNKTTLILYCWLFTPGIQ